jgi:hypothetical protein
MDGFEVTCPSSSSSSSSSVDLTKVDWCIASVVRSDTSLKAGVGG